MDMHAHAGATFNTPPQLALCSPSSFAGDDPQALAHYLITNGYDLEPNRSPAEYARLWFRGALVVVYHSGAAVVQANHEPSISLLTQLTGAATGGAR